VRLETLRCLVLVVGVDGLGNQLDGRPERALGLFMQNSGGLVIDHANGRLTVDPSVKVPQGLIHAVPGHEELKRRVGEQPRPAQG
jgi:hypothetical protein